MTGRIPCQALLRHDEATPLHKPQTSAFVQDGMRGRQFRLVLLLVAPDISQCFNLGIPSAKLRPSLVILRLASTDEVDLPAAVSSHPVLSQVYPALLVHNEKYGNPNIPLGTKEGKQCQTLRRLQIQGKLSPEQVDVLSQLGFRWHSFEDVYETADFDDLYARLLEYGKATGNVSPPKKYAADPELGAWVTGIRRLGQEKVLPEHAQKLNAISFEWTSSRKCGSAFMEQYRAIQARISDGDREVWNDDKIRGWVKAQQDASAKGTLSETRKHYMATILGDGWMNWKSS